MSAKLRKTVSSQPGYRASSMPSKFLYLYLQTHPQPAGGVMKLSWGQLMEELSMPLPWIRKALQELSERDLLLHSGAFLFVQKGMDRISNQNMVTSAIRKMQRLDVQMGPVPKPVWDAALIAAQSLQKERPYLQELVIFLKEKSEKAPMSVGDWDEGLDWMEDPEWQKFSAWGESSVQQSSEPSLSVNEITSVVQSILQTSLPAMMEPLLSMVRTILSVNALQSNQPVKTTEFVSPLGTHSMGTHSMGTNTMGTRNTGTSNTGTPVMETPVNSVCLDNSLFVEEEKIFFPVQKDAIGNTLELKQSLIERLQHDFPILDIRQELMDMVAYLIHKNPEKIPQRGRAVKYIERWIARKSAQVEGKRPMEDVHSMEVTKTYSNAEPKDDAPLEEKHAVRQQPESLSLFSDEDIPSPASTPTSTMTSSKESEPVVLEPVVLEPAMPEQAMPEQAVREVPSVPSVSSEEEKGNLFSASQPESIASSAASTEIDVVSRSRLLQKGKMVETDGFTKFWNLYPKKTSGRKMALQSWKKNHCEQHLDEILQDITYKIENEWDDIQYVPMATTYLNQARWEGRTDVEGFRKLKSEIHNQKRESEENNRQRVLAACRARRMQQEGVIDLPEDQYRVVSSSGVAQQQHF